MGMWSCNATPRLNLLPKGGLPPPAIPSSITPTRCTAQEGTQIGDGATVELIKLDLGKSGEREISPSVSLCLAIALPCNLVFFMRPLRLTDKDIQRPVLHDRPITVLSGFA